MWVFAQEKKKKCFEHCCTSDNNVKFKTFNNFLSKRIRVTTTLEVYQIQCCMQNNKQRNKPTLVACLDLCVECV